MLPHGQVVCVKKHSQQLSGSLILFKALSSSSFLSESRLLVTARMSFSLVPKILQICCLFFCLLKVGMVGKKSGAILCRLISL